MLLILLVAILTLANAKYYLILGSENDFISNNRVNRFLNEIHEYGNMQKDLEVFCSGGSKNRRTTVSEASKIRKYIEEWSSNNFPINIRYIIDNESKNTAENIYNFLNYMKNEPDIKDVTIVTSKFHQPRVNIIFNKLNKINISASYLLEDKSEQQYNWLIENEKLFIDNVNNDISNLS